MIGLSTLSLDSYLLLKEAAGLIIKNLCFIVWTKNSFSLGDIKELQTQLRLAKKGSKVALDLEFIQWENEIVQIDFYNDSFLIADKNQLSIWAQKIILNVKVNVKSFALNPQFKPNVCAVLDQNGCLSLYDLSNMTCVTIPTPNITYCKMEYH